MIFVAFKGMTNNDYQCLFVVYFFLCFHIQRIKESRFPKRVNEDIEDGDGAAQQQGGGVKQSVCRISETFGDISTGVNVQKKLAEHIGHLTK